MRRHSPLGGVVASASLAGGLFVASVNAGEVNPGNSNYYNVIQDSTSSWADASAAATAAGGHLVTITSPEEQAFIEQLLISKNAPTGSYWFGLKESATPNVFENVTGEPLSFSHFASGEPNNGSGQQETVGSIYWTQSVSDGADIFARRGGWNDSPDEGYPNIISGTPGLGDLLRVGYIVEVDAVAVPLPAAILMFPPVALIAGYAMRRMKRE